VTLPSSVRLRARLVSLGLIATAPALVVILYTQSIERARARERAVSDIRQVTQLAASQQATLFDGVQRLLLTLAQLPEVQSHDPSRCRALLPSLLRDHPGYINIWVNKITNTSFCEAIPVGVGITSANSTRAWYQRAVATRTTAVGDYQVSPLTGMPDVILAHPLINRAGEIEGIIAAAISLDPLNDIAARAALPPGTTLTLVDRQQRILARHPADKHAIGQKMPAPTGVSPEMVIDIVGIDGVPKLYATAPVHGSLDTGLWIGMEVDRDAAQAPASSVLRRQAVLLTALLLATLAATLTGGEQFVLKPIVALAEVTRRLAAGDLSARARLRRSAPGLEALAAAVNAMATEMEARSRAEAHAQAELRVSEERLRHVQKLETVGQLAAGVAHNFNNLLTIIAGCSELLTSRHEDEQDRGDLEEIKRATTRGAVLTRQLLEFSRRQDAVRTRLDLNQTLGELRDMLGRVLPENITLTISPSAEGAWVVIDRHEAEQVVLNLVLNARDAMPDGGSIDVDLALVTLDASASSALGPPLTGRFVRVTVRDTGTGMVPEVREHLFEPFFTTKAAGRGTGMGLASVDGIVRQNHGAITVDTAPGKGSTFTVYFPAVPAAEPDTGRPASSAASRPAPTGATILLVEDEDALRAVVTRMLAQVGYHVLDARSPSEALELFDLHTNDISMLLTDVVMPEMNGPALAERLIEKRPGLRVLFVSGYNEDLTPLNAPGRKSKFLVKPFSSSTLIATVHELLTAPD
jgi:signal transduction histidine kinase/CheY-like chemotaxis protein